jgi:hypothetical protein
MDQRAIIIQRFADIVDRDNCFDAEDARRLNMVIGNIIQNIFSESEGGSNQLQQEINRLIQDCQVVDAGANEPGQDNASNNTEPSESNSDEEADEEPSEEESDDEEEEEE